MLSLLDIGRETEVPDDPISQGEHVLLAVIGSVRTFFLGGPLSPAQTLAVQSMTKGPCFRPVWAWWTTNELPDRSPRKTPAEMSRCIDHIAPT